MTDNNNEFSDTFEYFKSAVLRGDEVEFQINNTLFFLGSYQSGTPGCKPNTIQNMTTNEVWFYQSRADMLNNFKFEGLNLEQIWPEIEVRDYI